MIKRYTIICLMALIILFVIHLFIIKLNYAAESVASPKSDESSLIQGLYSASDNVVILTAENFDRNVYNSSSSWLVQFYNSWCGHCVKFAPIWKQFAADIQNWRSVVGIGAVNCAADENTQHCREYDIMGYPTIRFFQPQTANITVGSELVPASRDDSDILRQGFLVFLETITLDTPVDNWPFLPPIHRQDVDLIVANKNILEFLLIVEEDNSYVGRDLIMDLNHLPWLKTRRILRKDYPTNESFQLFAVTKKEYTVPISVPEQSRASVFEAVRKFYQGKGYTIGKLSFKTETEDSGRKSFTQTPKQRSMVHSVFQADLETALIFSLGHEIPLKAQIEGEPYSALLNYLTVIKKYFPFDSSDEGFVERVIRELNSRTSITGGEFKQLVDEQGKEFLLQPSEWIGCAGSEKKYRGYTCGLWMMFHTLTIRRYANESQPPAKEILSAMSGYIENFFGCQECGEHFIAMGATINGNVTTVPDDVLWLWKAHNTVNRRLAGDKSEDPAFPKQQFPHHDVCSRCRGENGSWNESEVLRFLVKMYTHLTPRNRTNELRAEKIIGRDEETEGGWNFGLTDVNACIGLYVLSAGLFTAYTVRLFIKRSPRLKLHKYEYTSRA